MPETSIFKQVAKYKELHVYQKSDVLVQLTAVFCRRFLPPYGDRTVDQMNMAARCGKQNIVEGSEAAMTSSESELKLVNVGRSSFQELREDYEDYLKKKELPIWGKEHPRFDRMLSFCRQNNQWVAYKEMAESLSAEEFCNVAITLCHITDRMFKNYLKHLENTFITEGGIKERMYAARTGYRQQQDRRLKSLEQENARLRSLEQENARLKSLEQENARLKDELASLKEHLQTPTPPQ